MEALQYGKECKPQTAAIDAHCCIQFLAICRAKFSYGRSCCSSCATRGHKVCQPAVKIRSVLSKSALLFVTKFLFFTPHSEPEFALPGYRGIRHRLRRFRRDLYGRRFGSKYSFRVTCHDFFVAGDENANFPPKFQTLRGEVGPPQNPLVLYTNRYTAASLVGMLLAMCLHRARAAAGPTVAACCSRYAKARCYGM